MAGQPNPPTAEDIAATQAGANAGATAAQQGLTRAEVEDAITSAIAKHNPPNMSDSDIEKVADVLMKRFESAGLIGPEPPANTAPPAAVLPAAEGSAAPPAAPPAAAPAAPAVAPTDIPPHKKTFADNFLREKK